MYEIPKIIIINYIHRDSNHPSPIIKKISKAIEICLSNNSPNVDKFNTAAKPYNTMLKKNRDMRRNKRIQNPKNDKK